MRFNDFVARKPLAGALLFQGAMIPLALVLALLLGLRPWADLKVSGAAIAIAMLATIPPLVAAWLLSYLSYAWVTELLDKIHYVLRLLFRGSGQGAIVAVSLLAGFGEELLFRGVVQAGAEQYLNAWTALLVASVFFGLVHAITPAYFVLATMMGLYLGLLYQVTGNLLIACLVHALYDWAAITWYLRGAGGIGAGPR
jgi:uncharacterized protein